VVPFGFDFVMWLPIITLSLTVLAGFAQETDERPKLRRRERPASSFTESFTEGSLFKPNSKTVEGTLKRVECRGKTARIHIVSNTKPLTFDILDPKLVVLKGAGSKGFEFACGVQKPRPVLIEYVETPPIKSLYTLEFKQETASKPRP